MTANTVHTRLSIPVVLWVSGAHTASCVWMLFMSVWWAIFLHVQVRIVVEWNSDPVHFLVLCVCCTRLHMLSWYPYLSRFSSVVTLQPHYFLAAVMIIAAVSKQWILMQLRLTVHQFVHAEFATGRAFQSYFEKNHTRTHARMHARTHTHTVLYWIFAPVGSG